MKDDLISRAASIEAVERREPMLIGDKRVNVESFKTFLRNRPAVDAVPVVRCRDCKDYQPEPMCDVMMCYGGMCGRYTNPDDFCSYGRRKEVET